MKKKWNERKEKEMNMEISLIVWNGLLLILVMLIFNNVNFSMLDCRVFTGLALNCVVDIVDMID